MQSKVIFDFNKESDVSGWQITDDVVMGGVSSGTFYLSPDGFGVFEGNVSLENNGGFSSVRYRFPQIEVSKDAGLVLQIKGDGKRYQVRVKDSSENYYSYISYFKTTGEWQEIEVPLKEMYPSFRGRKLDFPNFSCDQIEEIVFLIGNKKEESFRLLIDEIRVSYLAND
ncbi:CIA30 family protein [Marinilabilia rubra]|uniref:CIA30 family protein n=2 Tax=Marinilabilia rubra TaxID=2162893 RepID=A0A2U2B9P2_9BACT|nr:CIA30 family protein [Marinilabilia rubra]